MAEFCGHSSQVMNEHNLIHLEEDVEYMEEPLYEYTAFDFENRLGKLKQLIRSPKNPIAQVFRRLSEIESCGNHSMLRYSLISNTEKVNKNKTNSVITYSNVTVKQFNIGIEPPDNVVQLQSGDYF